MENPKSRRAVRTFGISLIVVLAAGMVAAPGPGGRHGYGYGYGYGYVPGPGGGTPTPTVTPTPTTTPGPPHDTKPPRCKLRIRRHQTARSIARKGLRLRIRCNENARAVTRVYVTKKQARKLGIKRRARHAVRVGRKTVRVKAHVTRNVRVKLSKKARRGIRRMKRKHVRKLRLIIRTTARDAAGNASTLTRRHAFPRGKAQRKRR